MRVESSPEKEEVAVPSIGLHGSNSVNRTQAYWSRKLVAEPALELQESKSGHPGLSSIAVYFVLESSGFEYHVP
jgi:hypothetical protein